MSFKKESEIEDLSMQVLKTDSEVHYARPEREMRPTGKVLPNDGIRALDIVALSLTMTLGVIFSKALAIFSSSRHVECLV